MNHLDKLMEANINQDKETVLNLMNNECKINEQVAKDMLVALLNNSTLNEDYMAFLVEKNICNFYYLCEENIIKSLDSNLTNLSILIKYVDINETISGQITLFSQFIRYSSKIETIIYLLKHGADPSYSSCCCFSPLYNAIRVNRYDIVKILLEYGANPLDEHDDYLCATSKKKSEMFDIFLNISDPFMLKRHCSGLDTNNTFVNMLYKSDRSNLDKLLKFHKNNKHTIPYHEMLKKFTHKKHASYRPMLRNFNVVLDNCIDIIHIDDINIDYNTDYCGYNGPICKKNSKNKLYMENGLNAIEFMDYHMNFLHHINRCAKLDHIPTCTYCNKLSQVHDTYVKRVNNIRKLLCVDPKCDVSKNYYLLNVMLLINYVNKKEKMCVLTKNMFLYIARFFYA